MRRIDCVDERGQACVVLEHQDQVPAGNGATVPGLRSFFLESGDRVNFVDESTFKVVATNQLLRRR